jgi:hypothetical protein
MERVTDEEAGEGGWYWNEQVGSYRPPGALYCRECGVSRSCYNYLGRIVSSFGPCANSFFLQVLVQEYDHLCPWTGTGIGHDNIQAFKVFVVAVNLLCYSSIILVAVVLLRGLAQ